MRFLRTMIIGALVVVVFAAIFTLMPNFSNSDVISTISGFVKGINERAEPVASDIAESIGERTKPVTSRMSDVTVDADSAVIAPDAFVPAEFDDPVNLTSAKSGEITRIVDGDTLDIGEVRIRLALVNTPEMGEDGYAAATSFTRDACPVGSVAIYDEDDKQLEGSYGRTIAKVWCYGEPPILPESSINAMLVGHGYGEILEKFCNRSEFSDDAWASDMC